MPPPNKHCTSKCFTYWESDQNLIITKIKCKWNKYTNKEIIEISNSLGIYIRLYMIMLFIGCYCTFVVPPFLLIHHHEGTWLNAKHNPNPKRKGGTKVQ